MWGKICDKIKTVLAVIGGLALAILGLLLGRRSTRRETLPDNRGRADRVRADIDAASTDNKRAVDYVRQASADNHDARKHVDAAAADNRDAIDIIRRVRERGTAGEN